MTLSDIGKSIISLGAPLLGAYVGGPLGASILAKVANKFGANAEDPQDIFLKMQLDPNAAPKIIELENEFKIKLEEVLLKKQISVFSHDEAITDDEIQDVKDAREMQIITKDWMPKFITVMSFFIFGCILFCLFNIEIIDKNKNLIYGLSATIGWILLGSCRFHIGGILPKIKDLQKIREK